MSILENKRAYWAQGIDATAEESCMGSAIPSATSPIIGPTLGQQWRVFLLIAAIDKRISLASLLSCTKVPRIELGGELFSVSLGLKLHEAVQDGR